jgi:ATP-dependent DNA helicase RecQ
MQGRYEESLIDAAAVMIKQHFARSDIRTPWVVPVPSLRRPTLVTDMAERLSRSLGWPLKHILKHSIQHPPQIEMRNSHQQAGNVLGKFTVTGALDGETIMLVDDIADSKWTLTVLGDLLQGYGAGRVYPFALAVTNTSSGD